MRNNKIGTLISAILISKFCGMENNGSEFISKKLPELSVLRQQDGFLAFNEKPSDKYYELKENISADKSQMRINALELFSLFTANIIKEEKLFVR